MELEFLDIKNSGENSRYIGSSKTNMPQFLPLIWFSLMSLGEKILVNVIEKRLKEKIHHWDPGIQIRGGEALSFAPASGDGRELKSKART